MQDVRFVAHDLPCEKYRIGGRQAINELLVQFPEEKQSLQESRGEGFLTTALDGKQIHESFHSFFMRNDLVDQPVPRLPFACLEECDAWLTTIAGFKPTICICKQGLSPGRKVFLSVKCRCSHLVAVS